MIIFIIVAEDSIIQFYKKLFTVLFLPVYLLVSLHCGVSAKDRNDPAGISLLPGWQRLGHAALHALADPQTWVPATAAAGVYFSGSDGRISNWASTRTPVFGSQQRAADASDLLLDGSFIVCLATTIWRYGVVQPSPKSYPLSVGILTGLTAEGVTSGVTELLKAETGRFRPNGGDNRSFPSGHTSAAAVSTAFACRNIDALYISQPAQIALEYSFMLLTAGTAWARVEGKRHYLSDVLAGAALGRFFGDFFNEAFLGTGTRARVKVEVNNARIGMNVGLGLSFPIGN
jgi:membrane-associated phospholipid phosphatase